MTGLDIQQLFLSAMRRSGFEPDCAMEADGNLHRFRDWLDKPGTRNGWYVLFSDFPPAGAYGCWKRGIKEIWTGTSESCTYLMSQRLAMIHKQLADKYEKGHLMALNIWSKSVTPNGHHRYLRMKKVNAYGISYSKGALLIPVMDLAGQIHGLQRIYPDGNKYFTYGTNKVGHFYLIGAPCNKILCIAEGYSTAATIHELTGYAVVVAFDAGNLRSVAKVLRDAFPDYRILVCADDDKWTEENPGLTKAWMAAESIRGELMIPYFSDFTSRGTDFNDLYLEEGTDAVLNCFYGKGGSYV